MDAARVVPNARQRLRFYLGALRHMDAATFHVDGYDSAFLARSDMTADDFAEAIATSRLAKSIHAHGRHKMFNAYVAPIIAELAAQGLTANFLVALGDNTHQQMVPVFGKARVVQGSTVLMPLNPQRHFAPMKDVAAADIPFAEKEPRIVWRGATTGRFVGEFDEIGPRAFVPGWVGRDPRVDVGFTERTPRSKRVGPAIDRAITAAMRPPLTIAEQLGARYLLSLEGNDVASGLKWMLLSNSVVLMPPIRMESWACERFLRPFVHYVPVRRDLSDLLAVLDWCEGHPDECAGIVERATRFARMLMDEDENEWCRVRVVEQYARRVELRFRFAETGEEGDVSPEAEARRDRRARALAAPRSMPARDVDDEAAAE